MHRVAAISLLLMSPSAGLAQEAAPRTSPPKAYVHLDRPGVLERIQAENPGHYARIVEVLRVAQMEPCETLPQVLKIHPEASVSRVKCAAVLLLTSYPAKRHVSFALDDVQYSSNVVQYRTARALPLAGK